MVVFDTCVVAGRLLDVIRVEGLFVACVPDAAGVPVWLDGGLGLATASNPRAVGCTRGVDGFCTGRATSVAQPGLNIYAPAAKPTNGITTIATVAVAERLIARQRFPVSSKKIIPYYIVNSPQ